VARELSDVPAAADDPYAAFNQAVVASTHSAYATGPLARFGGTGDDVARAIELAITARHAPTRVPVTFSAVLLMRLRAWMSDRQWDRFVAGSFPRPGAA
jgi:hypothetical protein